MFLTEQYIAKVLPPVDVSKFPNYKVPYEQLLKQLTSQQHAILIDLGEIWFLSLEIFFLRFILFIYNFGHYERLN